MNASGVAKFSKALRGEVVLPRDRIYAQLRRVKNRAVNIHPAILVRCASLKDIQLAVRFARDNELVTAVRSGGHSFAGYGVCEDGLVIDLSLMKRAVVDPVHERIRIEPGSLQASWIVSLSPSKWPCRLDHVLASG
jgi:FAD/FMN-containing dehydrogenase